MSLPIEMQSLSPRTPRRRYRHRTLFIGGVVLLSGLTMLGHISAAHAAPDLRSTAFAGNVVVLGVNTTYQDDPAKVAEFVRDYGVSYPVVLDQEDAFGKTYAARLLPTSFLIDRSGNIVSVRVGEVDEAVLAEQIAALLGAEEGTP